MNNRIKQLIRLGSGILILALGILGLKLMAGMKKPLAIDLVAEKPIAVETVRAVKKSVTPYITGYGDIKGIEVARISAEVQGKIIEIHPRLSVGEVIDKGERLFAVDTSLAQLKLKNSQKRLRIMRRNLEIAKREHNRMNLLSQNNSLVSLSDLEQSEQVVNNLMDQILQIEHTIQSTQLQVDRSEVLSPIQGRVKSVNVEKGLYVSTGTTLITLVNDEILEMWVSLDSGDVMKTLRFKPPRSTQSFGWFSDPVEVPVQVRWERAEQSIEVTGKLDRVVEYNAETRTLTLAIRIEKKGKTEAGQFPIVEGMFCEAIIPGSVLDHVIEIPRHALNEKDTIYIASNNRLKTKAVTIAFRDSNSVYISAGIKNDEEIIITHLSEPLENSLLNPITPHFVVSKQ